jgi:hypothetical protein
VLEFYEKERMRRRKANTKQIATCYDEALFRKERILEKNEEFAEKSWNECRTRLARNNSKEKKLLTISRLKSAENKKVDIECCRRRRCTMPTAS